MDTIEAIYQNGVFRPLSGVRVAENQRVWLRVQVVPTSEESLAWMQRRIVDHEQFVASHGYLPDSTPDIAADRMRDV